MKNASIISVLFLLTVLAIGPATAQSDTSAHSRSGGDNPKRITIAGNEAIIPMDLVGRKPVVDVKINGKGSFKFFLDTGAGATVLDQKLADELKLATDGNTKIGDPADPHGITAVRNKIGSLEVGGATFSDVIGISWDRSTIYKDGSPRGVLGMPLFVDLLLTVDYPRSQIVIGKGSLPAANGRNVIQYRHSEMGLFGIPLKVGQQDMVATLDTGSPGGLAFPTEYMEKLPLEAKPIEVGKARTVGGEAIIYGAKLKDNVKLGDYLFENPNVTFFGRLVHLNIGYGFVSQFALTIDQKNERIRFDKPAASPTAETKPSAAADTNEYVGTYGVRRISVEQGGLVLQRLSGPQGVGPKISLVKVSADSFALPDSPEVRVKFVRGIHAEIIGLKVLTPSGEWESAARDKQNL